MGKKNKILIWFTIIIIAIIVAVISIIKVYNSHINGLYEVVESRIEYNAKRCFLEGICVENETTLDFLITNGYLERQIHPITKEYIKEELIIKFDGEECKVSLR